MLLLTIINACIVTLAVLIHYETLRNLDQFLPRLPLPRQARVLVGVLVGLAAHALEIWVFALAYYFRDYYIDNTALVGNFHGNLMDCVYFSFTTFSTLGFGDIHPDGPIRYLVGLESLTGLVLVAWTASYLYMEMVDTWENGKDVNER